MRTPRRIARSVVAVFLMAMAGAVGISPAAAAAPGSDDAAAGPIIADAADGGDATATPDASDGSGDLKPMIVGGEDPTERYEWMASFLHPSSAGNIVGYCGGTLVAPEWILSAGHCLQRFAPGTTQVRVGSHQWAEGGSKRDIKTIIVHPALHDINVPGNDIGLVQLSRPVTQRPIKIAKAPGEFGRGGRAIGWGATCNTSDPEWPCYPGGLQQMDTELLPDGACQEMDRSLELCIASQDGEAGVCYADSGAPEVINKRGTWFQRGVVIRDGDSDPRCSHGPAIYTDATKYADWVDRVISGQADDDEVRVVSRAAA